MYKLFRTKQFVKDYGKTKLSDKHYEKYIKFVRFDLRNGLEIPLAASYIKQRIIRLIRYAKNIVRLLPDKKALRRKP